MAEATQSLEVTGWTWWGNIDPRDQEFTYSKYDLYSETVQSWKKLVRYLKERSQVHEFGRKAPQNAQKCFLCQVFCQVIWFWKHGLSKLWQNLLIPARPWPPKNTSTDYSKCLSLCKWWLVIVTTYWFTTREVQARRDARPISLPWDKHLLFKMSNVEHFGGKECPEAESSGPGKERERPLVVSLSLKGLGPKDTQTLRSE